jgi:Tryptophan/tyrosine permease family
VKCLRSSNALSMRCLKFTVPKFRALHHYSRCADTRHPIRMSTDVWRLPIVRALNEQKNTPDSMEVVDSKSQSLEMDLRTYDKRRWSNLSGELTHTPGTLIGSATLVAGTTIGAGILALPAVTKVRQSSGAQKQCDEF